MSNRDTLADYRDMIESLDPDSAESLKHLIDDPINNINNATMANWTKSVMPIAIQSGNSILVSQAKSMHNEALNKIEFDNVTDEISALYNCAFEFKKAEMDLEAIANISDERIEDESLKKIESYLDNFNSSIKTAVTRTFGMLSSAAKNLKKNIIPKLKESAKKLAITYAPSIKKQFFEIYNKMVELFFRLLNEFVSKVFSFVEMIKGIGKSKGFGLKSVTISFEPPTFSKIDVFGFPIPIPKVSLPKVDINFEMELENEMSNTINNSIIIKEFLIRFKNTSGDFNIILEQLKSIIYDLTIKWDRQRRYVTNIRYLPITYGKDSFSEDYAEIKVEFDFNSIEIGDFFREVSDKVYDKFSSFILLHIHTNYLNSHSFTN